MQNKLQTWEKNEVNPRFTVALDLDRARFTKLAGALAGAEGGDRRRTPEERGTRSGRSRGRAALARQGGGEAMRWAVAVAGGRRRTGPRRRWRAPRRTAAMAAGGERAGRRRPRAVSRGRRRRGGPRGAASGPSGPAAVGGGWATWRDTVGRAELADVSGRRRTCPAARRSEARVSGSGFSGRCTYL